MKKCDVVFGENYSYSLEDAYAKIFECVDENGILCIQDFPDDECEIEGYISCRLKFDEKNHGAVANWIHPRAAVLFLS